MTNDRRMRAEQMRKQREVAEKRQRNVITLAIVTLVTAVLLLGGAAIYFTKQDNEKETELVVPKGATKDFGVLYTPQSAGVTKVEGAPVEIELYEDFLCPGCGAFQKSSGKYLDQLVLQGQASLMFRPYAFLTQQSTNRYSQRAANAAACTLDATDASGYKKMHDLLFANQPEEGGAGPDDTELASLAKQAGAGDISGCLKRETFTPWVEAALEAGKKKKVSGTPTVRIGGKDIDGAQENTIPGPAEIQKALDAAKG